MNRILFIEDDDQIRLALRLVLEDEGFDVREASDGRTGLAVFHADEPVLVLLDLRLPDLSGFEVCRALRAMSIVPIVMVTAQTDTNDMVAGLEAGADDYVTKPVVPKELAARIRAHLRRVQLQGDVTVAGGSETVAKFLSPRPSSICCANSPITPTWSCRATSCSSACGVTTIWATVDSSMPMSAVCG
jgi:DNA-binding response OmpR family regulator